MLGQALLTKRMGKTRVIAETGAGQHGVATATACAYLDLDCVVYMGEVDTERQALNVARMQLLGAEVVAGHDRLAARSRTRSTRRCATGSPASTTPHYLFGTAAGPHPFPAMVRDFCRGIGDEARAQCLELTGALPDAVGRLRRRRLQRDRPVRRRSSTTRRCGCTASRPAATASTTGRHAATITRRRGRRAARRPHRTCCRTRTARRSSRTRSRPAWTTRASAPSTPSWPRPAGRRTGRSPTPRRWRRFALLCPHRGDHPGDRVRARGRRRAASWPRSWPGATILVNLSGRGDKDMDTAVEWFGLADATGETGDVSATAELSRVGSRAFEQAARRGPGRAGRLPARPASPTSTGSIDGDARRWSTAGCDVIEVGLPYSDPVMDGPTIQAAAAAGAGAAASAPRDVLRTVEAVAAHRRRRSLVMTYWNPVERYGVERFAADLAAAGGAGLITPDLIPDEAGRVDRRGRRARPRPDLPGRAVVDRRAARDDRRGLPRLRLRDRGHGRDRRPRPATSDLAGPLVARTRAVTDLPVGVGLGVSNGDQAAEVAAYADGVIVGSAFVRRLLDAGERPPGRARRAARR